ncbi:twin-arginine translocase TatA/TatE family subunit [Baekduia sp.]|uniref:Sec-independent protein translocase subunit TatA/TatB n=1 Tax=Baekduia sp. TaxID=2600305 RepID=UPI0032C22EB0
MPIGVPEMLIILVIALVVLGPKKLPEAGKSLGSGMREFKRRACPAHPPATTNAPSERRARLGILSTASSARSSRPTRCARRPSCAKRWRRALTSVTAMVAS